MKRINARLSSLHESQFDILKAHTFFSLHLSLSFSHSFLIFCRARAQAIDFSIPYFHSGVSLLASPKTKSEIPLLAFLLPFSPELWIAIFTSLNITAVAVAVYEWLSPFGLNPWGRQRSKNFSLSSGEFRSNISIGLLSCFLRSIQHSIRRCCRCRRRHCRHMHKKTL